MSHLSPFAIGIVAVSVVLAGVIDLRKFIIPNALTVPLLISGILYHGTAGAGLQASLLGACGGFGILFGLYLLGMMGAGDVKFMTGIGAWLGVLAIIYVFAIAAAATALYSVVVLMWYGRLGQAVASIQIGMAQLGTIAKHLGANERVESLVMHKDRRKRLVPFAVTVALAVIIVLLWRPCG